MNSRCRNLQSNFAEPGKVFVSIYPQVKSAISRCQIPKSDFRRFSSGLIGRND
jgi:hypothetical protein